ncbi:hypothetical protein [Brucella sp. 22210]|uniref:hypothetical protein n=1 Tax=Brucella sp. 22210 TaxID=3453892 RepID=UPI003F8778D3
MTPQERARLIDKQEFEAECKAIRERAYALYQRGKKRSSRVQASINRGATQGVSWRQPLTATQKRPEKSWRRGPIGKQYTYQGRTMNAKQWADLIGMSVGAFKSRLSKGYTLEQAIETPQRQRIKVIRVENSESDEVMPGG